MALIVLSLGVAAGITMLVAAFLPARPRLADVLRDRPALPAGDQTPVPHQHPIQTRVLQLLERAHVSAPMDDLELVGQSRESFLLQRVGLAAAGAAWIPTLAVLTGLMGVAPPFLFTAAASLGVAVVGWMLPPLMLRSKAREARAAFLGALASYFELVALGRLGDRGPVEALRHPAGLGNSWAFKRIKLALDEAVLRGEMPWTGLERLAQSMGVRELRDLGQILTNAGEDGASIVSTLRAKAASIREAQLTAQRTRSAIRSDRMDVPIAFMSMAFIVFLAFPGLYNLIAT